MTAPVFVDSNILIYAFDQVAGAKQEAAMLWLNELWRSRGGRLSFQVLQEFYVNFARKWPGARNQARDRVRDLLDWRPVPVTGELLEQAWTIQDRYGLSFWDSLIVAAAKTSSSRYLLTEDLQPGQDFEGVLVVDPFRGTPGTLPSE